MMFHHINDGKIIKKSRCVFSYNDFIAVLESGLEFVAIENILTAKQKFKKCAITFDDGLKDLYRVAYPELKKRNIPFTIFIVTNFLDTEGYISMKELLEMSRDPLVTIASHGVSHDILKGMKCEEQKHELLYSKQFLEKIINKEVKYFAFSHGQFDECTLKILKESRYYDFAFGVQGYPLNRMTKKWKYHLPRVNFENGNVRDWVGLLLKSYVEKEGDKR